MQRLLAELQRLYFLPGPGLPPQAAGAGNALPAAVDLVDADGCARVMLVDFRRADDWVSVSKLLHALCSELDLPLPALSVAAGGGYRLWLSFAEPLPAGELAAFAEALRRRYLADLPAAHLAFAPAAAEPSALPLVPAADEQSGKWSAFIDPTMGSAFVDEPGLPIAPNLQRQAEMLAGLKSIDRADWLRVTALLQPAQAQPLPKPVAQEGEGGDPGRGQSRDQGRESSGLDVAGQHQDPKSFLLAVMNDPSVAMHDRISAAQALLPWFAGPAP